MTASRNDARDKVRFNCRDGRESEGEKGGRWKVENDSRGTTGGFQDASDWRLVTCRTPAADGPLCASDSLPHHPVSGQVTRPLISHTPTWPTWAPKAGGATQGTLRLPDAGHKGTCGEHGSWLLQGLSIQHNTVLVLLDSTIPPPS